MRAYAMSLLFAGSVAFLLAAPPMSVARDGSPRVDARVGGSPEAEVARIRAHFDSVLAELAERDLSTLTADQRATRASLVSSLGAYRDRGAFPKNYDFPGRMVPQFVDRKTGVRCAVAHLLESPGRMDIVERVRRANNGVFAAELGVDTAFMAWLDASGLTLAEAGRIQPAYGGMDVSEPDHSYRNSSAVALSASALTTIWNLSVNSNGQQPIASGLGLVAGSTTFVLGALASTTTQASHKLAVANGVVGATALLVSIRAIVRRADPPKPTPAAETTSRAGVQATLSPAVGPRTAGFSVNVRF